MVPIETTAMTLGRLDSLASGDSLVHRLDPRTKLLVTFSFIVAVLSFGKYDLIPLLPFTLYPVVLVTLAGLPWKWILTRLLLAAPFVIFVAIFNPFIDREVVLQVGSLKVSGGWISFMSIMIRFGLAVCAALVLVATTGIDAICAALVRLKAPRVFVVQILLMYRYLFLLIEEAVRMWRAHSLRSFKGTRLQLKTYGSLVGRLLLRTLDRGQAIHRAMRSRGFTGEIRWTLRYRAGVNDLVFLSSWGAFFVLARLVDIPHWLGTVLGGAVG